ncbi:MAG: anthranilate phosphoribosyltransferase [Pseudomonadota bacterium]
MLKEYIKKLIHRQDLTATEMKEAIHLLIDSDNDIQIGAFMALLHAKGETASEIDAISNTLMAMMIKVHPKTPVLDIVGTGGDGCHTINISTGAAILAAACGVKIAKHGNRASTSLCGSADVLEKLGITMNLSAEEVANSIDNCNFGFCFAPNHHPALGKLKTIRKKLEVPTVFNILGPLLNPARADFLMIGVFKPELLSLISDVLGKRNIKRALVFHGQGTDEITCMGRTQIIEINAGKQHAFILEPRNYGFSSCTLDDLRGDSAEINATILTEVLQGKTGPIADTFILNAGLANYLYGLTDDIDTGIALARKKHRDGEAAKLLNHLKEYLSFRNERKIYA